MNINFDVVNKARYALKDNFLNKDIKSLPDYFSLDFCIDKFSEISKSLIFNANIYYVPLKDSRGKVSPVCMVDLYEVMDNHKKYPTGFRINQFNLNSKKNHNEVYLVRQNTIKRYAQPRVSKLRIPGEIEHHFGRGKYFLLDNKNLVVFNYYSPKDKSPNKDSFNISSVEKIFEYNLSKNCIERDYPFSTEKREFDKDSLNKVHYQIRDIYNYLLTDVWTDEFKNKHIYNCIMMFLFDNYKNIYVDKEVWLDILKRVEKNEDVYELLEQNLSKENLRELCNLINGYAPFRNKEKQQRVLIERLYTYKKEKDDIWDSTIKYAFDIMGYPEGFDLLLTFRKYMELDKEKVLSYFANYKPYVLEKKAL